MRTIFWIDDRLAWPPVIAITYLAISLMVCDYIWRMVQMPFETLILFFALGNVVAIALIYGIYRSVFKKKRTD